MGVIKVGRVYRSCRKSQAFHFCYVLFPSHKFKIHFDMMIQKSCLLLLSTCFSLPSLVKGHGYLYSPRSLNWVANQDGNTWGEEDVS